MLVYRILEAKHAAAAFTGEGARLYGGRWNSPGVAVVYAASSLSLAILEMLVNASGTRLPSDTVYATIEIPDELVPEPLALELLPRNWDRTPAPRELASIGNDWAKSLRSVALRVPSAVAKIEHNVLLNPQHGDYRRLTFGTLQPYASTPGFARIQAVAPLRPANRWIAPDARRRCP